MPAMIEPTIPPVLLKKWRLEFEAAIAKNPYADMGEDYLSPGAFELNNDEKYYHPDVQYFWEMFLA